MIAVRDVHAAEVPKHLAEHIALASLCLDAFGRRAQVEHLRTFPRGHPACERLADLPLHLQAVGFVQVRPSGDPGADLQHPEILVKDVYIEIGSGNPRRLKGFTQLEVDLGIDAGKDEIRVGGKQAFQTDFGCLAQIHHPAVRTQAEFGPCIVRRRGKLSARQQPDVRKAADQRRRPFGPAGNAYLAPEVVGKSDPLPLRRAGRRRGGAGRQNRRAEQRRHPPEGVFHHLFSFTSSKITAVSPCAEAEGAVRTRAAPDFAAHPAVTVPMQTAVRRSSAPPARQ